MTCCVIWPSRTASQNSTKWDPWSSSRLRKSWQIWWEVCQKGWGFCLKIYIYYVVSCTNQTIIFHEYHLHFLHHHNYLHFTLFLPPHLPPATPTTTPSTVVSTSAALQLQYHCYHFRPFFWGFSSFWNTPWEFSRPWWNALTKVLGAQPQMSMCKVPRAPMNTERANQSTHWNWWSVHLGWGGDIKMTNMYFDATWVSFI